ncbi:hypothetical protein [Kitasatospora sp. NPDC059571]|uniref:hypothetical protein n=1 Tax=Kitasatospora sp. NPDC059571 TaxID=3346871 RepID=UPI0036828807
MHTGLAEIIDALAARSADGDADIEDEHGRWSLYRRSFDRAECRRRLLDAVAAEPDPNVALGIVLEMLGRIAPADRPRWVARLPTARGRDLASRRARELAVHESGSVSDLLEDGAEESWSDWLQLLLAESSAEPAVLRRMAERGRTKRIRRTALQRLKDLKA